MKLINQQSSGSPTRLSLSGVLAAQQLNFRYTFEATLSNVSFNIEPGKVTAILGPNGSGKSTLLRLLAGELKPESGSVSLANRKLQDWQSTELARHRAMLSQSVTLDFDFSVREVVAMGRTPHYRFSSKQNDVRIIDDALEQFDLANLQKRGYLTLSGGEQRRTQLARVFTQLWEPVDAQAPWVLLFDEPTNSLDLKHQHSCLQAFQHFANRGASVVTVLHDLQLAQHYADQALLLDDGKLISKGSIEDVLTPSHIQQAFRLTDSIIEEFLIPFVRNPQAQ